MKTDFTNKEFIENIYSHQDFIPAYNFFKATEDIKFLMKQRKEINEVQEMILYNNYSVINEWFNKEMNPTGYNQLLRTESTLTELEYKIIGLKGLINFFSGANFFIKEKFSEENYIKLMELFHTLNMPIRTTSDMQIETIQRAIKGVENEINLINAEKKKEGGEKYNYIKEVAVISNILKTSIDPLTISLSLFVEQIKLAKDVARN